MIDFKSYENYVKIKCEDVKFVYSDRLISHLEIEKIRELIEKYKATEVLKCIVSLELGQKFYIETKCDQCDSFNNEYLGKTKLVDYISERLRKKNMKRSYSNGNYICVSCEFENKQKQQKLAQEFQEKKQLQTLENTFHYIENYLNPNYSWIPSSSPKQRINEIKFSAVNWEAVSEHIQSMDYKEFLKTPYWKAIAAHTKYKAGYRCQLCNNANNLATHHRNYDIHGQEHAQMQELIVLCNDCHSKFHDIEE